jgi:hypothetical protein
VRRLASALGLLCLLIDARASAQDAQHPRGEELAPDTHVVIATTPPDPGAPPPAPVDRDAPPPARPRHHGLVLQADLGVLGFAGSFQHVAPPAFWLHTQLGFELLPWLMVFGEGELAFTDTSESQDESHTVAFPMWGMGGGLRATIHASSRLSFFVQGSAGVLAAVVPHDTLAVIGFRQAESLNPEFGGRVGVEWYQVDRHLALVLCGGPRLAQGFSRAFTSGDTPLMWDTSVGLRYTF